MRRRPGNIRSATLKRTPLDRATIVSAAIALADEEGLSALTMRNVASRLGFEVMSLYNHVANKNDLLAAMVDDIACGIDKPDPEVVSTARVKAIALELRGQLVQHPWSADLWLRHLPGPARTAYMESLLEALAGCGLSTEVAHLGFHAVDNHVLGYTLQEQALVHGIAGVDNPEAVAEGFISDLDPKVSPHTIAHVRQHLAGETGDSFEAVLDIILEGLTRL